jgi:carbonic anhydrase
MQVNFEPGNRVTWGDAQLELLQYHFHTPSEHAWDGQRSAMEAHLVHRNTATGAVCEGWGVPRTAFCRGMQGSSSFVQHMYGDQCRQ